MNADMELEVWREQWWEHAAIESDLRARELRETVERQSRMMRIGLAGDIIVTIVMGGGTIWWAWRSAQHDSVLVPIATLLFLAAAWVFVLCVNRGLWEPSELSNAAFLELSIQRCRRTFLAIYFAAAMFVAEVVFGLWWAYQHSIKREMNLRRWLLFGSARIDVVWICAAVFLTAAVWYWSKKQRELRRLLELQAEMDLSQ